MIRSKITGKSVTETEFNNGSIRYRLAKLLARVDSLEKMNERNQRELDVLALLGPIVPTFAKLHRDVAQISFNERKSGYFNFNAKTIRQFEDARSALNEALVAFQGIDSVLLAEIRNRLQESDTLLEDKINEFANFNVVYKFA